MNNKEALSILKEALEGKATVQVSLFHDAVMCAFNALRREVEIEPVWAERSFGGLWFCQCGGMVGYGDRYCYMCGRKLDFPASGWGKENK